jgi:hypothetical protein
MQRHFGGNPWQRLHQEVACGPVQKGILDHFAPLLLARTGPAGAVG